MTDRVQKIISSCGLMSRRAAEEMIAAGKVKVNGVTVTLGSKADPEIDRIEVDGIILRGEPEKAYLVLNKPKGYVTTLSDEKGRKNVSDLVQDTGLRLYPVGRLDINSEGLLIMTNDGDFANRVMHPSGNVLKTYKVWVRGENIHSAIEKLGDEIEIDGSFVRARNIKVLRSEENAATLLVTISEWKNRQVRRMCEYAGLYVTRLCRTEEGSLKLGTLKSGEWRWLTDEEVSSFLENEHER